MFTAVLETIAPFFGLILAGYIATRRGAVNIAAIPALNNFVLFFALPCMLFAFGRELPFATIFHPVAAMVYVLSALFIVALALMLAFYQPESGSGASWKNAAFGALVAAFPNSGFIGLPLLTGLLGTLAAAPTILTILIDMVITSSLCVALSQLDKTPADNTSSTGSSSKEVFKALFNALKAVVYNPMPWALLLGMLVRWQEWTLFVAVDKMIAALANSASPLALFTIGAVLARAALLQAKNPSPKTNATAYVPLIIVVKLIVHPLLILLFAHVLASMGWHIDDQFLIALVLVAALPSASNVSLLSERMGADNNRIVQIILLTTVYGFFSFSLLTILATK